MFKKLWSKTIWGDPTIDPPLGQIGKYIVPFHYAILVYLGIAAMYFGVPTLSEAFDEYQFSFFFGLPFVYAYGLWQVALAGTAAVGYIFHNRWSIEVWGLSLLYGQWLLYIVTLVALAIFQPTDMPFRGYGFGLALFVLASLTARYLTLRKEIERAAVAKELVKRAVDNVT